MIVVFDGTKTLCHVYVPTRTPETVAKVGPTAYAPLGGEPGSVGKTGTVWQLALAAPGNPGVASPSLTGAVPTPVQ